MAESSKIHPATLVNNIKSCIPITLDYKGKQFNTWSTLFQLHYRANLVIEHIIPPPVDPSTKTTTPTPAELTFTQRLEDIVRQWIYATISPDLMDSIIDPDDKAIDAWKRLEEFFLNNKSARALQLDAQFTNTRLEQFEGVTPYCSRLKSLADGLKNVGDKVSDNRMALQLLKGLSEEYKPFRTSVRHLNPLPSFDTLRSMLELEEQGNMSDHVLDSSEEAHVVHTASPQQSSQHSSTRGGVSPARGGRKNNKGKGGKGKSAGSGGRNSQQSSQQQQQRGTSAPSSQQNTAQQQQGWMFPPWAYWGQAPWATPPCPYPSQGQGPVQWTPRTPQLPNQNGVLGPRPQQAYYMAAPPSPGYVPTNIEQAMHTLSMADPNYYMDTGATSHMTNSQGLADGEQNSEM